MTRGGPDSQQPKGGWKDPRVDKGWYFYLRYDEEPLAGQTTEFILTDRKLSDMRGLKEGDVITIDGLASGGTARIDSIIRYPDDDDKIDLRVSWIKREY